MGVIGGHKTNLHSLPIYTEAEEAEASIEKTPIENYEVTPPPPQSHTRCTTRLYYGNATRL
ncbi:family 25 glycosyl transferase [Helicobacter pylori NY40]|uniref:Family 25 glycosyl transferase n=1 Tax=Helicobacter pylori NY40 TaxID=1426844 RepID=A0A060PVG5_HELPX|nr:family 25 glycosyl transferase [Helicobacter pylori NY40]